jgi:hypothetical protein
VSTRSADLQITTGVRVTTVVCPTIEEWNVGAYPHTLLIGAEAAAAATIAQHVQFLRSPLRHWRAREGMKSLPTTGTLVIWDISTLNLLQQEELFTWMNSHAADVQVISVAECPLFPLVSAGAFLEKLYYRLNLVCLLLSTAAESRAVQQPTLFSDIQAQLTTAKSRRVARRRTEDLSTIQERLLWSEVNV